MILAINGREGGNMNSHVFSKEMHRQDTVHAAGFRDHADLLLLHFPSSNIFMNEHSRKQHVWGILNSSSS